MGEKEQYRCRIDWGCRGALRAAARGDIIVLVDVLSFTTAVATAVHHGAYILPCTLSDNPQSVADRAGAAAAVRRREVPHKGRYSLSPLTYIGIPPGTRVVVASPNGAACAVCSQKAPYVFAGSLINVKSTAAAVARLMAESDRAVTVVACGEQDREAGGDEGIRWAVEDYLGAGAILALLPGERSPEAAVCAYAFEGSRSRLEEIVRECQSGRELRGWGYENDVAFSSRLDVYDTAPVMRDGMFQEFLP